MGDSLLEAHTPNRTSARRIPGSSGTKRRRRAYHLVRTSRSTLFWDHSALKRAIDGEHHIR